MDKEAIAQKLAKWGRVEATLMRQLARIQAKRCALLTEVATMEEAQLSPDVLAAAVAPKEEPDNPPVDP